MTRIDTGGIAMLHKLILYFVDRLPRSGRTQIVKYVYLADLESRRHRGRSLTGLKWQKHNHDPFDPQILSALESLTASGDVSEEQVEFPDGKRGWLYSTESTPGIEFSDSDQAILDLVVKQYGDMTLRQLLDDVVYESEPMKNAADRRPLDMSCVNDEAAIPGISLDEAWAGFRDAQAGRTVTLDSAMRTAGDK